MPTFNLREMQLSDSPAVSALITEESGMMTTYFIVEAYRAIVEFAELPTIAAVAETPGFDGLVGMVSMRFGTCQFNGAVLPFAFLDSLKVEERFRRQGLGAQLMQWVFDRAEAEFGSERVLLSGTSTDNIASQNTMKKSYREFTQRFDLRLLRTTSRSPQTLAGITIREAEVSEYPGLAEGQNTFYQDYNLYPPVSAASLAGQQAHSPTSEPLSKHYVAVTPGGEIIAGASVRYQGFLMYDKIKPPPPLRVANVFLRLFPADYTLRSIQVSGLWFANNQEKAALSLLDTIRYVYHYKGHLIGFAVDARSPFATLLKRTPLLPIPKLIMAVDGPEPMDRQRVVYTGHGRA